MPWWAWGTIGAMRLVAEMTIVDLEFRLVLLGASALMVGLIGLSGIERAKQANRLVVPASLSDVRTSS